MSALHQLVAELHDDAGARAQLAALIAPARTVHTVATLARELEVSDRTIRRAIEGGELAATRRAGRWTMTVDDVRAWVQTGPRPRIGTRPTTATSSARGVPRGTLAAAFAETPS